MKGVILAGGMGSRLMPLTKVTNKHLLPIYDKPMIYYPLQTLMQADIKDILIISGPHHAGDFLHLLGSGKDFARPSGKRIKLTYEIQDEAGGIAHALGLARDFVDDDDCTVILGDNIFEDDFGATIQNFKSGAAIFYKEVSDPGRFGVAEVDKSGKVLSIEEKPQNPKSNYAVTGLYVYDKKVFEIIKNLKPSGRGELEITDVNNAYIAAEKMQANEVKGYWSDAGTFESLFRASELVRRK